MPIERNDGKKIKATPKSSFAPAYHNHSTDSIIWGGNNLNGSVSPVGAALSAEHSANRLAYLNPNALAFEYSDNGGSSWTTMSVANSTKVGFVTTSGTFYVGNASTVTTNHRTRVTLTAQNGTTGYVYTRPRKLLINVSSAGHGLQVTLEIKTGASGASWTTVGTYALSGWSGWNDIPLNFSTLGGGTTQTSNIWYMRLTFATTSVNSSYATSKSSIISMRLFGDTCWTRTSNMGETGHLYSYDTNQNATFPAGVTATTFTGALSGNATSATKATQDSKSQNIASTYIKALSVSGTTITYTRGDGTTGTITTQDTNTTYSLSSFGITASATELNYVKGVTSAIQTQLNGKAASSHTHSYMPLSGGTFTGAAYAQANTSYTTYQLRNIALSTSAATPPGNGSILGVYS